MDLASVKQVGISAAYKGAEILQSYFGNITRVNKKGAIDLVTEAEVTAFLELVPHADYVDVADAAHMIAGDKNDVFTRAVVTFLDDGPG